jgi:GTP pyrophosphokinase
MINNWNREDLKIVTKELWQFLEPKLNYLGSDDKAQVELAFELMIFAHGEQRRKAGDFYVIHPVMATSTLTTMQMDMATICACLLHDVPEDTEITLDRIKKDFGPDIAFLVAGVTKLGRLQYAKNKDLELIKNSQSEQTLLYAENLRKMLVAMSKDIRVIFIKLADRLHNLQTLASLPAHKAQRIALESLEIYAPIAERLGMNYFKGEIEDLCFKYVYPTEYESFVKQVEIEITSRLSQLNNVIEHTKTVFEIEKISYINFVGRAKKYYSIFKKIQKKSSSIEGVQDLIALRVIVPDEQECYKTLACIHRYFEPIDGRIKDYIFKPKINGYQSIHTTVCDKTISDLPFEFQIRTQNMHDFAEYGVASHWSYKNKGDKFLNPETLKWMNELVVLCKEDWTEEEYLKHVKLDLFKDKIFVLTPKSDTMELPLGATCLDFAFKIHEYVGSHAKAAKINGKLAKLDDLLQTGDIVTIITDKNQKPKREWLNLVKTATASRHLRSELRKMGIQLPKKIDITDKK